MSQTMADIKKQAAEKMAKSIDTLKHNLAKVRTGRAHAGLLDHLRVDYYGTPTPINQMANVSTPEPRLIVIQPWDPTGLRGLRRSARRAR